MKNFIDNFIDVKAVEDGVAQNTIIAYREDIKQFEKDIEPISLENVKQQDIEKYLKNLQEKSYSPRTLSRKISCIREFFKFLQSEKIIKENPANKLNTPKIDKSLPSFLTKEEVEKIYRATLIKNTFSMVRMRTMIKLMYSSGLRVSELVSLPENAINYDTCQIFVRGKGNKERFVPITKNIIGEIFEYMERREAFLKDRKSRWMFPSINSLSGHMTRYGFFKNLKKIAIIAGVSPQKVHPHVLRHSFATRLINKNADLRSIQKMLGHESITTTEIYTHITTDKLIDEVKKHHPLANKEK